MPYKKRYKKRYNKNFYDRNIPRVQSAMNVASKALVIATAVKKLVNVEYKFHDVQVTSTAITDTPTIIELTNIPQGDTDITRDGAQVKLVRINIKYSILINVTAASTQVRCMLVHDRQTNQAIYTATDLLADATNIDNITSMLNLDNKYRFQVLYNKVHTLSNVGRNNSYSEVSKQLNLKIRYDGSTPDITDLTSSSLSWLVVGNQATSDPIHTFFSRVRYIDN